MTCRSEGLLVYVAGPMSKGDSFAHVSAAIDAADELSRLGHFPYVPHLSAFWHMIHPKAHGEWIRLDLAWLGQCDALVRLPGDSPGADEEVAHAHALGLQVYLSVEDFQFDRRSTPSRGVPNLMAAGESLRRLKKVKGTFAPYLGTVDIDAPFGGQCFHCWVDGRCKTCGADRPVPGPAAQFGAGRVLSACPKRVRQASDKGTAKGTAKGMANAVGVRVLSTMLTKVLETQRDMCELVRLLEGKAVAHRKRLEVLEQLDHEKAEELERLADELKLLADFVELPEGVTS